MIIAYRNNVVQLSKLKRSNGIIKSLQAKAGIILSPVNHASTEFISEVSNDCLVTIHRPKERQQSAVSKGILAHPMYNKAEGKLNI